jgi:MEDS: MEthanogen/methylotroph, DcmR Sensory domain
MPRLQHGRDPSRSKKLARRRVAKRIDACLTEEITGWALNAIFPIPHVPDLYAKLPWRRVRRVHGAIGGIFFVALTLSVWPFELGWELLRSSDRRFAHKGVGLLNLRSLDLHGPVFQFQHGDHICVFYRHDEALLEVLIPYVVEGLRKGERCFCVQSRAVEHRLVTELAAIGFNVEHEIHRGSLQLHSEEQVYFQDGVFDPQRMIDLLSDATEETLRAGFTGFRSAGDLSWSRKNVEHSDSVYVYEKMVEKSYPSQKATGLCQYRMDGMSQNSIDALLESHKFQVIEPNRASRYAHISMQHGSFLTEIVAPKIWASQYDYVVRNRYSERVADWGTAANFSRAIDQAKQAESEAC